LERELEVLGQDIEAVLGFGGEKRSRLLEAGGKLSVVMRITKLLAGFQQMLAFPGLEVAIGCNVNFGMAVGEAIAAAPFAISRRF
jgi:hypothetical protein